MFNIQGQVEIFITTEVMGRKKVYGGSNLVTSAGLDYTIQAFLVNSVGPMTHIAVGTDNAAAASAQTALSGELARIAVTATTTETNQKVRYNVTIPAGTATGDIVEAGLFDDASAGVMFSRVTFPTVSKGSTEEMEVNWTIQFRAGAAAIS